MSSFLIYYFFACHHRSCCTSMSVRLCVSTSSSVLLLSVFALSVCVSVCHIVCAHSGGRRSYYEVLGVPDTASDSDISRAFRSLSRKLHPDKHGNAPDKVQQFQELQEAYDILSNPDMKIVFDMEGKHSTQQYHPHLHPQTLALARHCNRFLNHYYYHRHQSHHLHRRQNHHCNRRFI